MVLGPLGCVAAGGTSLGVDTVQKAKDACLNEPTPDDPHAGVGEMLAPKPVGPSKDPFVGDPPPSIYQRYGFGGMYVPVYDLGCVQAVGATPLNTWSNLHLRGQVWADALSSFFHRAGQTKLWWDALDPVVESSSLLAQRLLWGPRGLFAVALAALAAWAAWKGRQGEPSVLAHLAVVGLAVFLLGQFTAFRGVETTHMLRDRLVAFTTAFDGSGYDVGSDTEARQLRYRTWLSAEFGDADSPVAQEYGPKLLDCFGYRWDDPQTPEKLEEKQGCVHALMDELTEKHSTEAAYAHGAKTSEQWFSTGIGFWWGSLPVALWKISAGLAGIVLFMFVTMSIPAMAFLAPVALYKPREVLWPIFKKASSLFGMAIGCQLVAQIVAGAEGILLASAQIPWLLRLVFCIAVVVTFWVLGRSLRKPMNGWAEKKLGAGAGHAAKGALRAAEIGGAVAAGIPPGIIENMGKKAPKVKGGQAPQQNPNRAAEPGGRPSWLAPPIPLPGAGQTGVGRPPVAWAHGQTGPPAGPGTYQRADGTYATAATGTRPVAALGPGVFALPAGDGTRHDPVIHTERHRQIVEAVKTRMFPNAVGGDIDRRVTGTIVAEGRGRPVVDATRKSAIDVIGWVAPTAGTVAPRTPTTRTTQGTKKP